LNAENRLQSTRAPWRIVRFDAIDSTNEEARRRALAGETGRLWILADAQSMGRGRRGRTWASPKGNLHATALLIDPCPPAIAPQLGFLAGVALARSAQDVGAADAGLKWPNDLMVKRAKCAGILVESTALAGGRVAYAIGIGVNCADAPGGFEYATARLTGAGGRLIRAAELFENLLARFEEALVEWQAGEGFDAIRAAWLRHAVSLGERIGVEKRGGRLEGVFEGIDSDGRLLLRSERGLDRIEAADVWPIPQASRATSAARPSESAGGRR
jgi:BirA family biotin operon repressor/biotin-[acetyl-CoA-carboxylase] ligase